MSIQQQQQHYHRRTNSAGGLWCRINKLCSVTRDVTPSCVPLVHGKWRGRVFTTTPRCLLRS